MDAERYGGVEPATLAVGYTAGTGSAARSRSATGGSEISYRSVTGGNAASS